MAVGRVMRTGAYSNRVVETGSLTGREREHFRFLTFTTLRHLTRIDRIIESYSSKQATDLDPEVLDVLRVGVAELLYADAPPHAVVDSAVESVKQTRRRRAAGFVNAVLRSVERSEQGDAVDVRREYPSWLVAQLERVWEVGEVDAFLTSSLRDAPRQVRARPGAPAGPVMPVAGVPNAFQMNERGALPEGYVVQDAASVAVGNAVPLVAGELILDMAAAPGGKAAHLADRGARVVALDRNARRVADGAKRLPNIRWVVGDGLRPPLRESSFDHVLLDAPCSGLGTMRRRPEVRYRTDPSAIDDLARRQRALLESALRLVRRGGTVTYSVCTVTPAETVEVVAGFDAGPPAGVPGRRWGNGMLLAPHLTGTDGMFVSLVRRR